jgi:type VI secretion system protein ImpJ
VSRHRRVVWNEGMLLAPQHLQQWERHVHHQMAERFRAVGAFDWGLTRLEVDHEAMKNGRLALLAVAGVLQDGTPFRAPEDDPLPTPRAIEGHFATKQETVVVSIGFPSARPGQSQLGDPAVPGSPGPRYSPDTVELADDNDPTVDRAVVLARRNLTLLFPDDAVGDHDALPIAEVARTAEGGFAVREAYVPPCLAIGTSEALMRQLRTTLEKLITKSFSLGDKRRQRGGVADFSSSDALGFWQLGTVNTYIPTLQHYVGHRRAHPEQVYLTLATLVAELCTISTDTHPKDLPAYEHGQLGRVFAALDRAVGALLEFSRDEKAIRIDLERQDSLYVGRITDPRLLEGGARLYLGARAELEEQSVISDLPAKLKIGSRDNIDFLIANALRGVPVTFLRVPPAALPVRSKYVYFQLDPSGDAWEAIRGAKNIAIFAPPSDLPGLSLELVGLRE